MENVKKQTMYLKILKKYFDRPNFIIINNKILYLKTYDMHLELPREKSLKTS